MNYLTDLRREFVLISIASLLLIVTASDHVDVIFPPPVPQSLGESKDPPGHLKPFGWQRPPDGPVIEYDHILPTEEYWEKHVKNRIPCVFRQGIKKSPAIKLWTDEYLREKYGDLDVLVELKKENRTFSTGRMRLNAFLDRYQTENLYVVSMLPKAMMHEIQAVPNVMCGTFQNFTHESNLWISNGGTRSVIHYDADHNIHCMLAGRKDVMMMANKYSKWLYLNEKGPTSGSGFSSLDPDVIDMNLNPNIAKVPWTWATLLPGDCIYIPGAYLHQVRAYVRSISATTLFTEEVNLSFNNKGCYKELINEYHTMDEIKFHWTYEFGDQTIDMGYMNVERLRNVLLDHIRQFPKNRWTEKGFDIFYRHFSYGGQQLNANHVFKNILKADKKGYIDEDDIRSYTRVQLKVLARAMDPPHGPKTNGTEKVIMNPWDTQDDDKEKRNKDDRDEEDDDNDDDDNDVESNERKYEDEKERLLKTYRKEGSDDGADAAENKDDDTDNEEYPEENETEDNGGEEQDLRNVVAGEGLEGSKQETKDEL